MRALKGGFRRLGNRVQPVRTTRFAKTPRQASRRKKLTYAAVPDTGSGQEETARGRMTCVKLDQT